VFGGNGEGNYLGVSTSSSVTISLDSSVYMDGAQYFGIYLTASDVNNTISFYQDDALVFSFSNATLLAMIPKNLTLTAINGSTYNTNNYYGQPGTNLNSNDAYAYLNFVATEGTTFNKVVLSQLGSGSSKLETDNHSIMATAPVIPSTLVDVPEPSVFAMSIATVSLLGLRRHRNIAPELPK
jgi:hypothetical protein